MALNLLDSEQLAQASCNLEINVLNEPIGKQDQYISSYGGIREFTFKRWKSRAKTYL